MPPIRFSIIDYLNALPLNMAFKDRLFENKADLFFDYPSQCADNLATGKADVGLISSIEYQRIPNLLVIPEIAIAAREEVRSVLILSRKPLGEARVVALDRFSRSSVALLRILLHRRYGLRPRFVTMSPNAETMLAGADAALIIGDAALDLPDGDFMRMDLASEWFVETGLPFVFAFWAMRDGPYMRSRAGEITAMLSQAKAYGLSQIEKRMAEIRTRWPLSREDILAYFSKNIHYDLGKDEKESLALFFQYAAEAHLIPEAVPLRFA